eukprot:CAMPEP_0172626402 /NCGR_PEP_ID=MMETSP1068-20121228/150072_1 /TAXON_ID=35684 /ORGANISM="Pseudopedinella elastica, Strain CCMP716" /LENGTH=85 /DNA_ID=CAMNT_0013436005 /DNA_START=20 /DNA_END=275 /DNA_ORIENTATION=+
MAKVLGAWKGAADEGHSLAQYGLGKIYREGVLHGSHEYRKAADQGNNQTQFSLGACTEACSSAKVKGGRGGDFERQPTKEMPTRS